MDNHATGGDQTFGPKVDGLFDFTLEFEHIFMTVVPAALVAGLTLFLISRFRKSKRKVKPSFLLWVKVGVGALLLSTEIASLVLWAASSRFRSGLSLGAAVASLLSGVCILVLLYGGHIYSISPSTPLSIYLSLSLLLDIVKTRSYFTRAVMVEMGIVSTIITVAKLALIILEEIPKKEHIKDAELRKSVGREAVAGFWQKCFTAWLNATFIVAFGNTLTIDDLDDLGKEFDPKRLAAKFQKAWGSYAKKSRWALVASCIRAMPSDVFFTFLPRLVYLALSFTRPFLIQRVMQAVMNKDKSNETCGGLIGATALVYFGLMISDVYYQYLVNRTLAFMRATLVGATMDHNVELSEEDLKKGSSLTLTTTDMSGIEAAILLAHDVWASVVAVAVGLYILAENAGAAAAFMAIPSFCVVLISYGVSSYLGPAQKFWNDQTEIRVTETTETLKHMTSLKMMGFKLDSINYIRDLMNREILASKAWRMVMLITWVASGVSDAWSLIAVAVATIYWTRSGSSLNVAEIYTALSIVALLQLPVVLLMTAFTRLASSVGSLDRLIEFLSLPAVDDKRQLPILGPKRIIAANTPVPIPDGFKIPKGLSQPRTVRALNVYSPPQFSVQLVNVCTAPFQNGQQAFNELTMEFPTKGVCMVTGPVGCGKSTLLKTILGEVAVSKGHVRVDLHSVAYCAQVPWLQNISIRENVLCGEDMDRSWYDDVISACGLKSDLLSLPDKDETLAGTDGRNLSGGQRHRVALARAVYSQRRVLLMDNIFSSLDRNTARTIFQNLFGQKGLLRGDDISVILVTNIIDHLTFADKVYLLDATGNITNLASSQPSDNHFGFMQREADLVLHQPSPASSIDEKMPMKEETSRDAPDQQPHAAEESETVYQKNDFSLYGFYSKTVGHRRMFLLLLGMAFSCLSDKLPLIYIRIWDAVGTWSRLFVIGLIMCGVFAIIIYTLTFWYWYLVSAVGSVERMHTDQVETVFNSTLAASSATSLGSLSNRFSQDIALISRSLPGASIQLTMAFFMTLFDIALISSSTSFAACIIPVIGIFFYLLQLVYLRTSRQLRQLEIASKGPLAAYLVDVSNGIHHIRAYRKQPLFRRRGLALLERSQKPFYQMYCIQQWLDLANQALVAAMAILLTTFALLAQSFTSEGSIGLGLIGLITFSDNASALIRAFMRIETALGAVARIRHFVENTPQEQDAKITPAQLNALASWPSAGEVEFSNMSARYEDKPGARRVLQGITFKLERGTKVAIVGRTGSGKSSLLLTMTKFLVYSGGITIDGKELRSIPRDMVRQRLTVITQDSVELPGTIRSNLQIPTGGDFAPAEDDMMKDALHSVGLWERVAGQGGLDAELTELHLSYGEKQLITFARAIVHHKHTRSKLALMDEITSQVDAATEERMCMLIEHVFAECTMLIVAHRGKIMRSVDAVGKLHEGRLESVEQLETIEIGFTPPQRGV